MHPQFLSNTYVVAGGPGQPAAFIDAGGPVQPLIEAVEQHDLRPTHVLLTHHHYDHVCELDKLRERFPGIEVLIHPNEAGLLEPGDATGTIEPGEVVQVGDLRIEGIHTPGHTSGMLSFLTSAGDLFTGDTLFKDSVGGVRAPDHTTYADLRASIMDRIMTLPPETTLRPGHTEPSTVGEEWEGNAFVRVWRGLDPEGAEPCKALGEDATLVLWGDDYDGGHKAWVRWPDGSDDIVPGSRVERGG
jgi:glyoxylase-like metal-dependent hydrolase (beta-lactamase superfamily II)